MKILFILALLSLPSLAAAIDCYSIRRDGQDSWADYVDVPSNTLIVSPSFCDPFNSVDAALQVLYDSSAARNREAHEMLSGITLLPAFEEEIGVVSRFIAALMKGGQKECKRVSVQDAVVVSGPEYNVFSSAGLVLRPRRDNFISEIGIAVVGLCTDIRPTVQISNATSQYGVYIAGDTSNYVVSNIEFAFVDAAADAGLTTAGSTACFGIAWNSPIIDISKSVLIDSCKCTDASIAFRGEARRGNAVENFIFGCYSDLAHVEIKNLDVVLPILDDTEGFDLRRLACASSPQAMHYASRYLPPNNVRSLFPGLYIVSVTSFVKRPPGILDMSVYNLPEDLLDNCDDLEPFVMRPALLTNARDANEELIGRSNLEVIDAASALGLEMYDLQASELGEIITDLGSEKTVALVAFIVIVATKLFHILSKIHIKNALIGRKIL